jgi:hypothetical protein
VKANLGPLRYLLVTPQSHRVHHSIEARHADRNFGVILSVWDRLFGTQWQGADEYPECGSAEPGVPLERSAADIVRLSAAWAQCAYPFRRLAGKAETAR